MPKGYWVAALDVWDVNAYKAYVEANAEAFGKYKAKLEGAKSLPYIAV